MERAKGMYDKEPINVDKAWNKVITQINEASTNNLKTHGSQF